MKSKNHLIITGLLVTDVAVAPGRRYGRFTLLHNFGGRSPALFLPCRIPGRILEEILAAGPKKNDAVTIKAYIRPMGDGVEAVVKALDICV